jgi:hypothetical protein
VSDALANTHTLRPQWPLLVEMIDGAVEVTTPLFSFVARFGVEQSGLRSQPGKDALDNGP